MDTVERELPQEYKDKIKLALEGNPQLQKQIAANAAALKKKLDDSYQKIRDRNERELAVWEKVVGPIPDFQGIITKF